ncbi:xylosyltransferase oxt-like [Mytilus californianus]|uniref:xylosyltransferase oxt-like n=1 Tax=Mytilus californianus TaxID=6549 RepID=UPI002246C299|nr:xylosyltransferase oxt-like [Mytilus californianus]
MKAIVVVVSILEIVLTSSANEENNFRLSIKGAKDVPIRGFLLGNHGSGTFPKDWKNWMQKQMDDRQTKMENLMKGSDNTMMAKIEGLKQLLQNTQGKIETSLTAILKKVDSIQSNQGDKHGYIGCFLDASSRHLSHRYKNFGDAITLAKCRENCKGYKYAGLQYSVQCFCGNQLENTKYPKRPDSECNTKCRGEPSRMCGGTWRNSIYTV